MSMENMFEDQMEIEAMAIASSQKNAPSNGKNNAIKYETDSVDLTSRVGTEAAFRELKILQQHCIADYKDWANHEVKYTDLSDDAKASAAKMKRCNDSYTMSMLMQCITPFSESFDLKAIASSWFTFKVAEMMNPNFAQDRARLYANYRNEITPALSQLSKQHPVFGKMLSNMVDKTLEMPSANLMEDEIRNSERTDSIDDLSMTPRQLAALKLNFMEQYYVDSRSLNPNYSGDRVKLDMLKEKYDTALQHVANIATNGNYDMSVVAAEERYLVGLKVMENPNYANIFQETWDVYAAKPVPTDLARWDGDFKTADGHDYTVGDDASTGAFTVRTPMSAAERKEALMRRASEFASMKAWAQQQAKVVGDKELAATISEGIDETIAEFKSSYIAGLKDDGVANPKQFWKENFESVYKNNMQLVEDKEYFNIGDGKDFATELNHIINKDCAAQLGIKYDGEPNFKNEAFVHEIISRAKANNASDPRFVIVDNKIDMEASAQIIWKDMTNDFLRQMKPKELEQLMYHVGANMEQSQDRRQSFSRSATQKDAVTKDLEEYVPDTNAGTPGAKSSMFESKPAPATEEKTKTSAQMRAKDAESAMHVEGQEGTEPSAETEGPII